MTETKFSKQFLSALESTTVAGKLATIIKEAVAESLLNLRQEINDLAASVAVLRTDLQARDVTIAQLGVANDKLKDENCYLRSSIEALDCSFRRENLIFSGLTLSYADVAGETSTGASSRIRQQVLDICQNGLDCEVTRNDISCVTVLPRRDKNAKYGSVIVRFTRRDTRDDVFFAKKKLADGNKDKPKESRIFINEDLTNQQRKLFASLRQKKKDSAIEGVWTKHCNIYVKLLSGSIKMVKSLSDL